MYGIVLEGGGARGSYQIGVWQALKELGIEYSAVVGSSVGALNGAMMVQGEFEKALQVWSEINPSKVINLEEAVYEKIKHSDFTLDSGKEIFKYIRSVIKDRGIDIAPLRELVAECIDEEKIRGSGLLLGMVTVSLSDLSPLEIFIDDIPPGKLVDYLMASANLPVFKIDRVDGKLFLDGGFYNNLPIDMLERKGYKDIIAVRLNSFGIKKKVDEEKLNITYINPSEDLGTLLDFSNERARRNIQVGYYDALRVFKGYKGKKYYLEIDLSEEYFFNLFLRLEGERLEQFFEEFNLPAGMPQRRYIFEKLIPMVAQLMEVSSESPYETIALCLLERMAEKLEIERLKVYQWDELLAEAAGRYSGEEKSIQLKTPKIFKGSDLVYKVAKSQILDRVGELLFFRQDEV